jgi:hypothetical protein
MRPPRKAEMHNLKQPVKQFYSESDAASSLGISLNTLHSILDKHVFNDGVPRPMAMELALSDVLLVAYWMEQERAGLKLVPAIKH